MRKVFFLLSFFSALHGFSQDSTIVLSKFEQFQYQKGRMTRNEITAVDRIKNIRIAKERLTDMKSGQVVYVVKVNQSGAKARAQGFSRTVLYFDMDEIDGVISSLDYYATLLKTKPLFEPVYSYTTSNNINVDCEYEEYGYDAAWVVSLQKSYSSGLPISGTLIQLRNKDIDEFIRAFKDAKSLDFIEKKIQNNR